METRLSFTTSSTGTRAGAVRGADDIFLEGMIVLGVRSTTRKVLYWGVRLFGGVAWRKCRRPRRMGRIRVALIAPEKSAETGASMGA